MNQPVTTRNRIGSIDVLRGIVMVIMAIDHTRDFFYSVPQQPLDLQTTTPIYYFTRWITHFCAPVFLMLAGSSAYLMGLKMSKPVLSTFLMKRGIWLVFAEIAIVTLGITYNPLYNAIILQVIWATGISMFILGFIVRLPFRIILIIGICIVLGHNLLDPITSSGKGVRSFFWDLLHGGIFKIYFYTPQRAIAIIYSFLAWTGIMTMGYCLGKWFEPRVSPLQRRNKLIFAGTGMIMLFIVLRWINQYGDPVPWSVQRNTLYSFLSFINVNKYPPSLMYILITIGPALILLALIEPITNKVTRFFTVFGRVPFFYYLIHFYLIHLLLVIAFFLTGHGANDIVNRKVPFLFLPEDLYFNLWVVYGVWALVILIMYPLCKKYDRYKNTHSQWWLKYL